MNPCEKCGRPSPSASGANYDLHDYCAECGTTLCKKCMVEGHCGFVPAKSGLETDSA